MILEKTARQEISSGDTARAFFVRVLASFVLVFIRIFQREYVSHLLYELHCSIFS